MPTVTNNTKRSRQSGWSWSLLMFSLVIFTAVVVSYFSILFGYNPFLNQRLASLDEKIQEVGRTIPKEDQENLASFYSQLVNAQGLLRNHVASSKIFNIIERNTNQNVSLSSLKLNVREENAEIEAVAQGYESAIQQAEAFRRVPEIREISIGGMQKSEQGGVRFGITIEFSKNTLHSI